MKMRNLLGLAVVIIGAGGLLYKHGIYEIVRSYWSCTLPYGTSYNAHFFADDYPWTEKSVLKGGASDAKLFKVSDGKQAYVIRDNSVASKSDRVREIHAQSIASQQGYGPHLYAYDLAKGQIMIEFLEQSSEPVDPESKALQLAQLLRSIHDGPKFCYNVPIIKIIKSVFYRIKQFPAPIDKEKIARLIAFLEQIQPLQRTATHRDLNRLNIMFTQSGYKVIDFEGAGFDDPFFDIATIILFNFKDGVYEPAFLHYYFSRDPSQEELQHLGYMKKATALFYGCAIIAHQIHASMPFAIKILQEALEEDN